MADALRLQMNIRQNAEELQDILQDNKNEQTKQRLSDNINIGNWKARLWLIPAQSART